MAFWWQELSSTLARSYDDPSDRQWNPAIATLPVSERGLELLGEVEEEFRITGAETPRWDAPHLDPDDEWGEDSDPVGSADVTDHEKFDIVRARATAWINVLRHRGCDVRTVEGIEWATEDAFLSAADRCEIIASSVEGNPELVIGFNDAVPNDGPVDRAVPGDGRIDRVANVVIALGDPAVSLARVPDCGCDICDYGSDVLLQQLDSLIFSVVDGSVEAQSGGKYTGYRTSFDSVGEFAVASSHKRAKHRARPWFPNWSPRPMQDWA